MARKISGPGKFKSIKDVKDSLKSKGNANIRTVPSEDRLTVRFITEPDGWHGYYEHWMQDGPVPCTEDDCPGCSSDDDEERRRNFRYLANAYIVDDSAVKAIKLPKSLADQIMAYYEKMGTIMDRDYDLGRTGSGKNGTKYQAFPDSPSKMNLKRFRPLDLDAELQKLLGEDPDEDDDETPVRPKTKKSRAVVEDDDDDEDDDPWADEDETPRRTVKKKTTVGVKKPAVKNSTTKKTLVRRTR